MLRVGKTKNSVVHLFYSGGCGRIPNGRGDQCCLLRTIRNRVRETSLFLLRVGKTKTGVVHLFAFSRSGRIPNGRGECLRTRLTPPAQPVASLTRHAHSHGTALETSRLPVTARVSQAKHTLTHANACRFPAQPGVLAARKIKKNVCATESKSRWVGSHS